jgi:hypothetical protein
LGPATHRIESEPPPERAAEAQIEAAIAEAAPVHEPKIPETGHAFQAALPPRLLERDSPAFIVSNLSPGACSAELRRRKLPIAREAGAASGIAIPVRITGPMHGVRFLTPSRKSVYGKLDCRLALALDELAQVLERHGVVAARVDNLYRPRARLPGRRARSQHRYGLAMDVMSFQLASGIELSVEHDWRSPLESFPCGPESRLSDPTERAIALRDIVCDVARSGLFHHILTPSFNAAHRDHLHLDIKRGERRWVVE